MITIIIKKKKIVVLTYLFEGVRASGNPGELTEPRWWRNWRWKWRVVFGRICSPQKFMARIGVSYARKIAIWRMHYTQLKSVKPCYLYADWWERVGCNVMYWPWHGCPRRISQKWDNKVYSILFYICYIIPDLKSNLGPGGPPASLTLCHCGMGSVVQRSLQWERERQDTIGTSRSSANDKHLCLISVIDLEGPDKSHQVTGSKGRERLTGSSSHLERLCQIKNCMLPEILSYLLGEWKRSEHHSFLFVLRALNKI